DAAARSIGDGAPKDDPKAAVAPVLALQVHGPGCPLVLAGSPRNRDREPEIPIRIGHPLIRTEDLVAVAVLERQHAVGECPVPGFDVLPAHGKLAETALGGPTVLD